MASYVDIFNVDNIWRVCVYDGERWKEDSKDVELEMISRELLFVVFFFICCVLSDCPCFSIQQLNAADSMFNVRHR